MSKRVPTREPTRFLTPEEIIGALRDDCVFELGERGGHWQAFYRLPYAHNDFPEVRSCTYHSVYSLTAVGAVSSAYEMWCAEQTRHRLTR
jgi:hypothetical protein